MIMRFALTIMVFLCATMGSYSPTTSRSDSEAAIVNVVIEQIPYGSKDLEQGLPIFLAPSGRVSRVPGLTVEEKDLPGYVRKFSSVKGAKHDIVHILVKDESTSLATLSNVLKIIRSSANPKRTLFIYIHLKSLN